MHSLLWWLLAISSCATAQEEQTCRWEGGNCLFEPNLQPMTFNLGNKTETFWAYVPPDVATFYQQEPGSKNAVKPNFIGQFAKFVNLSPKVIRVYW